jgi:AraC-like DNA-binding protein
MISIAEIDARSFRGRAEDHPAGAVIPPHRHRGAQLLFASSGVLRVEAARSHWVVPPNRAVWLPPGERDFEAWAAACGASARTLARLFRRETGLSFRVWRQQVRLIAALERLSAGESVGRVSAALGYRSASAFTAMFRRALGRPPQDFLRDRDAVQG